MQNRQFMSVVNCGSSTLVTLDELDNEDQISNCLGNVDRYSVFLQHKWVEFKGTEHRAGCYIVAGIDGDRSVPRFVRVLNILSVEGRQQTFMFCESFYTQV